MLHVHELIVSRCVDKLGPGERQRGKRHTHRDTGHMVKHMFLLKPSRKY